MQLIYHNEYHGIEFSYFEKNGYILVEIPQNDYTYIHKIADGDVLFIKLDDIDYINANINKDYKLTIFLFINHEYCNRHRRKSIIENRNANHRIFFITTHLDNDTSEYDLALRSKCLPFKFTFSNDIQLKEIRSKQYNFFNRSINLRRLKAFELLKGTDLVDCYYTFGNIIKKDTFGGVSNAKEFLQYRNNKGGGRSGDDDLIIDVDLVDASKHEFVLLENREDVENGVIQGSNTTEMFKEINTLSADSYVSFIIESSGDGGDDLRITEKTIRAWLYKNIFLSLQCKGFGRALRNNGIETFEDVFNLDSDWDETDSETKRIEIFVNALKWFNQLSMDEVKHIYNSDSVQQRLENNYRIVNGCFNPLNAIMEIEKLIGYENNVFK
jgi:hypothetical protein